MPFCLVVILLFSAPCGLYLLWGFVGVNIVNVFGNFAGIWYDQLMHVNKKKKSLTKNIAALNDPINLTLSKSAIYKPQIRTFILVSEMPH